MGFIEFSMGVEEFHNEEVIQYLIRGKNSQVVRG
jgi:hypothetical protein